MVTATVLNGIVTLTGEVETELERGAAGVAAESVRSVGGVVNRITLASAEPPQTMNSSLEFPSCLSG